MSTQSLEVKNRGGRPVKYTPEFADNESIELEKWLEIEENIFIEKFCCERNYHDTRIPELCKLSNRFSHAISMLMMKQKLKLFEGGLTSKYKYPMCSLILGHNHNIVTKTEQKITGSAVDPLNFVLNSAQVQNKELISDGNEIEIRPREAESGDNDVG